MQCLNGGRIIGNFVTEVIHVLYRKESGGLGICSFGMGHAPRKYEGKMMEGMCLSRRDYINALVEALVETLRVVDGNEAEADYRAASRTALAQKRGPYLWRTSLFMALFIIVFFYLSL